MNPDIIDITHRLQVLADLAAARDMPDAETVRSVALEAVLEIEMLRSQVPDTRPFGPGTLDVLLAAETADPGAVCDAIEAIAGEGSWAGVLGHGTAGMNGRGFVVDGATLAALVRALRGGIHGA